jgi:DNA mismatch repair protein MutS
MGGQQQTESGPELQLGQQTQGQTMEPNNILLTGPNGSGKSTFLKSVMTNIILAQTLGIAFAKEIRLTPFQYLSTYLNIPDCQGRESLFQAEMTRCHQHLELLRNLEQRPARLGFSFNIMDEIFVSTNYLEGMSGAYAVIKHLGTLQNSCHIITTHFDKLTISDGQLLTQNTIPGYTNKYFRIDTVGDPRSDNPEIHKDYLLRDGVNDRHLALHLLKLRGFDEELVRDAKEMYSRLTSPIVITPNENNNVLGNIPPQETPIDEPQKDEINQILDEINSIEPTTEPSTTDTNIVEPSTEPILNQEAEKNNTINPQE